MFEDDALQSIVGQTKAYPYFLQEWGKHTRDTADAPRKEISARHRQRHDLESEPWRHCIYSAEFSGQIDEEIHLVE